MRIMSIRIGSVARITTLGYAVLGFFYIPAAALTSAENVTLPVGIVAPLVNFNFNLTLPRPEHFLTGILMVIVSCLFWAATGWLTGVVGALGFNFLARRLGGIDASVVSSEVRQT